MKEFRYHPEIKGLKVNEDGSEVLMNDMPVVLKERNRGKQPFRFFYYKDYQIGLAKLVLECWQGVAPEAKFTANHIDGDYNNYHYENLCWGPSGGNSKCPPKLNEDQKTDILKKVESGQTFTAIAKEYGVSRPAIAKLTRKQKE
ncbi:MAG: helix-turn-helix domain-containing protein [Weeksellaceae bacterium]|nr:Hin recombinase [Bacteroidota bacterium]MCG2780772.1 helix-turn-helix domain-containing protein [Weeksellaceae bacterium]